MDVKVVCSGSVENLHINQKGEHRESTYQNLRIGMMRIMRTSS
jgi:hypothetical protein